MPRSLTSLPPLVSGLALALGLAACGGKPAAPAMPQNHASDAAATSGIRAIDFLNYTYTEPQGPDAPMEKITVVNGDFQRPKDADGNEQGFFHVDKPAYGDVDGDGVEDAIVVVTDNTGGTGMFDSAEIYTLRAGKVAQIASVPGGDRGDGGLHAVVAEPGGVRVERYQSVEGDGACCPSKLAIEHWHWTGGKLQIDDKATTTVANPDKQ